MPDFSNRPWLKTALDLSSRKWRLRRRLIEQAQADLEQEVYEAFRDPAVSERREADFTPYEERLKSCCAFGQYSDPVPEGREPQSQYGLFGTSAAFYVLSLSAKTTGIDGDTSPERQEWIARYLKTLNFLDFVVTTQANDPHTGLWSQREMTLRVSMLLRSLAAADKPLRSLALATPEPKIQAVVDALKEPLNEISTRHAVHLCEQLAQCAVPVQEYSDVFRHSKNSAEQTWLYSLGDKAAPRTADEWVFTWSQVLTAIARLSAAGLVKEEHWQPLCSQQSFEAFRSTVLRPPDELDRRFQLMGLWALSHFDHATTGGPIDVHTGNDVALSHTYLTLTSDERRRVKKTFGRVSRELLTSEVELVDCWLPYSLKASGGRWRDDYMVVPVVAVLIQLVARYRPTTVTDSSVMRLVRLSVETDERRDVGRARPYQLGNRDGIVNLAYWRDAHAELLRTTEQAAQSRLRRFATTANGMWRGYGRATLFFLVVAAVVGAYLGLLNSPTDVGLGLIFGLGAAYLAAVSAPPVVSFFWSDRY